jgi:predicted nucleic acid-binding protein
LVAGREKHGDQCGGLGRILHGTHRGGGFECAGVVLEDRVYPFGRAEAECAARLYRAAGRKKPDRLDSFIAATAIIAQAPLATRDRRGFQRFVPFGLKLA